MEYSQQQISQALADTEFGPVARQTISDDINWIRKENARKYRREKGARPSDAQEIIDKLKKLIQEGWFLYYEIPLKKPQAGGQWGPTARNMIRDSIVRNVRELRLAMGITTPTMSELEFAEKMKELEKEHEKIRILSKVKPLAQAAQ